MSRRDVLPPAFLQAGTSSFSEFVSQVAPDVLPFRHASSTVSDLAPHGTTIVSATFPHGVVMAGDRRATMGNFIAQRDIQKVYASDEYSLIGIAGAAGLAVEMVRLFQVELEHYEKIEGAPLSLDGKANRLAAMIRQNLPMALQGLAVLPLFSGWDHSAAQGRIFSYDATGGRYEETAFHAVGSGAIFARGALKKLYRPDLEVREIATVVVQALFDAADDDSATGGPDLMRQIYPIVMVAGPDGVTEISPEQMTEITEEVVASRRQRPDGPAASLI